MKTTIGQLASRLWDSAAATSYASFLSRSLGALILLPLVLSRLSVTELNLWYLFASIAAFQLVVELGFTPTFSRLIAYAMGGASVAQMSEPEASGKGQPDWDALGRICATMSVIYARLSLLWLVVLIVLGSLAVTGPLANSEHTGHAWSAWGLVVVGSVLSFLGTAFVAYLIGINQVALVRRWEVAFAIGSTLSCVIVLLWWPSLLALVLTQQFWIAAAVLRNWRLSKATNDGRIHIYRHRRYCKEVGATAWPRAWRTGLGAATGTGVIQLSAIIYAQFANPAAAVTYFLALRLIQLISVFSQAPFYSKLPEMARLYATGETSAMLSLARRGMRLSYLSFLVGFAALELAGAPLLKAVGSNADFPQPLLWNVLGIAFFIERFGAMHINLYGITNRVIQHIANGSNGALQIVLTLVTLSALGGLAYPVALLTGNLLLYAPYAAYHCYRAYGLNFLGFERTVVLPIGLLMLAYCLL